ncbi:unnamed protein product [Phytophthora fragariaefolia]|uniref:Unnamed protein product n=1 Tax=Phytophthora fragariaefolia TaxID=1490495 RepID=A0A9W6XQZ2_9STRA|nr:unnamed protein product [Phytophthora fragariaefolia]
MHPARHWKFFAANGVTFDVIMHKLWQRFSGRVTGMAVKQDDIWTVEEPVEPSWDRVMQFKWNRHLVPASKSEEAWNRWVVLLRGETVLLLIYEYGLGIPNDLAYEEFLKAYIRPINTDRSGVAAESSLREAVEALRDVWGRTHQGPVATWRML